MAPLPSVARARVYAVIFNIAGNIARNRSDPLMIFVRLQEFDYPAASYCLGDPAASLLLLFLATNTLQSRFGRRVVGH